MKRIGKWFCLFLLLGLIGYPPLKIRWAKHQVELFCAHAVVGGPIDGLADYAKGLGLEVRSLPAGWDGDPKNPSEARIVAWEGFSFGRWFCDLDHTDGKIIRKQISYLD